MIGSLALVGRRERGKREKKARLLTNVYVPGETSHLLMTQQQCRTLMSAGAFLQMSSGYTYMHTERRS